MSAPDRLTRTREVILEAALVEMASGRPLDMASIAGRARVDRSTIYRHFDSREALLRELSDRSLHEIAHSVSDACAGEAPFETKLERFLQAIFDVGDRYVVLVSEEIPPREELLNPLVRVPLQQLLKRGVREGRIRSDLPVEWLLQALWALIGPMLRSVVDANDRAASRRLLELFLHGAAVSVVSQAEDGIDVGGHGIT